MDAIYSIRESLQGRLQTFIRESGFGSIFLEDLIRDLVVLLSAYREEDHALFPEVYVIAKTADLSALFTNGKPINIGTVVQTSSAASTILKDCATLASGGWAVFAVVEEGDKIRYGVFRSIRHSLSTGSDETISDMGKSTQIMLIRNRGHHTVELQNTSKSRLTAIFKITSSSRSDLESDIEKFVDCATRSLEDASEFKTYFRRLLMEIVQRCHGTLLAAIPPYDGEAPRSLTSGVMPDPHIDLFSLYSDANKSRNADSFADLRAAEVLLQGMIASDGIVVFGCDGTLKAYRSFIKPEESELRDLPTDGGGRRRTYELLKTRIPIEYSAALFRSQDGETKCERTEI